jgi:hypothetical protein
MSLPTFSTQSCLFSTAALGASLFPESDRYRLFAKLVFPCLAAVRSQLEACYADGQGRPAIEPVLLLGTSFLQFLEGLPDRQAVEMLRYHAGWNFALNRQLGDEAFHHSTLSHFRQRLEDHDQSALGFQMILDALVEAGLVERKSRQRLASTQMLGRVSRMSRLDCVRESFRLALQEVLPQLGQSPRPAWWAAIWERYVENQLDYRAGTETLVRKFREAGQDSRRFLVWLESPEQQALAAGERVRLLARVFSEQFEVTPETQKPAVPGFREPLPETVPVGNALADQLEQTASLTPESLAPGTASATGAEPTVTEAVEPKAKEELETARVINPHDPEATYAVKGQGEKKKEHVGYKIQVAETVCGVELKPGEPTRNFVVGIVTHPALESDEAGAELMAAEQAAMGLEKPPALIVDGAYVSAEKLAVFAAEGRSLIGPAAAAPRNIGERLTTEQFEVRVEQRAAVCPAGYQSSQCSRLENKENGKVTYRFEFAQKDCAGCALRERCLGKDQNHRSILVGEHHTFLQERRREQQTPEFKEKMKERNAIEGTQSELVRGHGMRRARYRGLEKVRWQNYMIGAACNVKRWLRREAWKLGQALLGGSSQASLS